jgi:integrase
LAATESENFAHVDEKDLPELLVKMDSYKGDALTIFGLKLMAYCFPRTSELIEAPWTEFDLDRARWDIPAERMKMKTPHIIPSVTAGCRSASSAQVTNRQWQAGVPRSQ